MVNQKIYVAMWRYACISKVLQDDHGIDDALEVVCGKAPMISRKFRQKKMKLGDAVMMILHKRKSGLGASLHL